MSNSDLVRTIKTESKTQITDYNNFGDLILDGIEVKPRGDNKSFYLSAEAIDILKKFCCINKVKPSNVIDRLIKDGLSLNI